jgi:hypothetical protein
VSEVTLAMGGHELQPSSFARSLPPARICDHPGCGRIQLKKRAREQRGKRRKEKRYETDTLHTRGDLCARLCVRLTSALFVPKALEEETSERHEACNSASKAADEAANALSTLPRAPRRRDCLAAKQPHRGSVVVNLVCLCLAGAGYLMGGLAELARDLHRPT